MWLAEPGWVAILAKQHTRCYHWTAPQKYKIDSRISWLNCRLPDLMVGISQLETTWCQVEGRRQALHFEFLSFSNLSGWFNVLVSGNVRFPACWHFHGAAVGLLWKACLCKSEAFRFLHVFHTNSQTLRSIFTFGSTGCMSTPVAHALGTTHSCYTEYCFVGCLQPRDVLGTYIGF